MNTLHHKTQEDLLPPGWVRRATPAAAPSVLPSSTDASSGAVRMAAADAAIQSTSRGAPQDPAGGDIKIVFDEASSSSGEFDLVAHKIAAVKK